MSNEHDPAKIEIKVVSKYEYDKLRTEFRDMMHRASHEIKGQRALIERLTPKADAYDKLSIVLELLPGRSQGYGDDVASRLDHRIAEIDDERNAEKGTTENAT